MIGRVDDPPDTRGLRLVLLVLLIGALVFAFVGITTWW